MSTFGKAFIAGVMIFAPSIALVEVAEAQPPIRIGASLSQTGAYAALGQNQRRGYQLCVKHTNEKGGVLGRKIELVVEDDQSQPTTAIRIYERLITQEKVDLVLGPYSSTVTEAVADVNEKYRMPMVAPAVGTTSIFKKGRKFIFQVFSRSEENFEGFVELVARNRLKTIALINEDSLFPHEGRLGTGQEERAPGGHRRGLPPGDHRFLRDPDQGPGHDP